MYVSLYNIVSDKVALLILIIIRLILVAHERHESEQEYCAKTEQPEHHELATDILDRPNTRHPSSHGTFDRLVRRFSFCM